MNFSLHWGGLQLSVVLSWYPRLVGNELLPQVMDFKYFGVLFMSEKMREMSMIVKLSIYWLIYASTLTYNHERRVVTETMRLQATEMTFLWKLSRKSRVPTPHTEIGQVRLFWHLTWMTPRHLVVVVFWVCHTGKRPQSRPGTCLRDYVSRLAWECLDRLDRGIPKPAQPPPLPQRRWPGVGGLNCCSLDLSLNAAEDGWMDHIGCELE